MSSKSAGSATGAAAGGTGARFAAAEAPATMAAAAATAPSARRRTSETIRHPELQAPLGVLPRRLPEVRIGLGQRRDELLVAGVVVPVEEVEHLRAHLEGLASSHAERL